MDSRRGLKHLDLISNSIYEIYRCFGAKHLNSFPENFALGDSENLINREPVVGTQDLARRIAGHYRLPVTTVIVTFSSSLIPPGRVELSNSNEFFIELQSRYRSHPKIISAILAHEIAHIFLHRCGVKFLDDFENEVLTDTIAVYAGFGPTILNAAFQSIESASKNDIQATINHFGYITLDEFGYLLAKRDGIYNTDSSALVSPGISTQAFQNGCYHYAQELNVRPFIKRPFYQIFWNLLCNAANISSNNELLITFNCPCCSKKLRIPASYKKLLVHCSNCDSNFFCYS